MRKSLMLTIAALILFSCDKGEDVVPVSNYNIDNLLIKQTSKQNMNVVFYVHGEYDSTVLVTSTDVVYDTEGYATGIVFNLTNKSQFIVYVDRVSGYPLTAKYINGQGSLDFTIGEINDEYLIFHNDQINVKLNI